MARRHAEVFLQVLKGEGFAQPNPRPMFPNPPGLLLRISRHAGPRFHRMPGHRFTACRAGISPMPGHPFMAGLGR
jgi:hypothetical protein